MLFAHGETRAGSASVASHLAIDRDVLIYAIRRVGVCYDTRFVPPSQEPTSDVVVLWMVRSGALRRAGEPPRVAPFAMTMLESTMEGARGARDVDLHTCGQPFEAIELRLRRRWAMRPIERTGPVTLSAEAWAEVDRYITSALGAPEDDALRRVEAEHLIHVMHREGVIREEMLATLSTAPDASMGALWGSIRAAFELLDPSPSMKTLAADTGLSLRHTARLISEAKRGLLTPPGGWRETIRTFRTKLAVVLLSGEDLSIADVATAVGYQRAEAMTNAFRRDGLPPPSEVRRRLLATHEPLRATPPREPGAT